MSQTLNLLSKSLTIDVLIELRTFQYAAEVQNSFNPCEMNYSSLTIRS